MRFGLALVAAFCLTGPALGKTPLPQAGVIKAELIQPTDRYDHAVLGDALEWGGLRLTVNTCPPCADQRLRVIEIALPGSRVFEDIEARVLDVTGDGLAEVVVVETDLARGAQLAVYDANGRKIAATGFYGQTHRWLAPAGVGDFDGDGRIEIAYVDRPHLERALVFVRLQGGRLDEVGRVAGLTNHRIGDSFITSAVRNCGQGDEVIMPSADWSRLMVVRMGAARDLGRFSTRAFDRAKKCR